MSARQSFCELQLLRPIINELSAEHTSGEAQLHIISHEDRYQF